MQEALGIVFSDIQEWNLGDLTAARTAAAIPFAGRYWLIDFVLSNMINSGIRKVGVITKSNYQSLMAHIGSGKDWDLSRKNGGITILPPYGEDDRAGLYKGRLDALIRINNYISTSSQDYIVLSDCDIISNINYKDVIEHHIKNNADITAVYHEHYVDKEAASRSIMYTVSRISNKVDEVTLHPQNLEGTYKISMNTWIMRKDYLLNLIANAISNGKTKFSRDVLFAEVNNIKIIGYEYKGYCAHIDSVKSYFKYNMEMLKPDKRNQLFYSKGKSVYTKVRDSEPAKYGANANIKNSLIADGSYIDGTIENSVIFRGVKIGKNTSIKNCIIMQDTIIGEDCELEWVISDKEVVIRDGKRLIADSEYLLYIIKNMTI